MTDYIIIALLSAAIILLIVLLLRRQHTSGDRSGEITEAVRQELQQQLGANRTEINAALSSLGENNLSVLKQVGSLLQQGQHQSAEAQVRELRTLEEKLQLQQQSMDAKIRQLQQSLTDQQNQFREAVLVHLEKTDKELFEDQQQLREGVTVQLAQLQQSLTDQMNQFRETTAAATGKTDEKLTAGLQQLRESVNEQLLTMLTHIRQSEGNSEQKLESMRKSLSDGMAALREENGRKLDEIRGTVDEKLQSTLEKRIAESFKSVSEQLEQVYRGLGEMQSLASDVGGLKKVLSGVKTRGILGEVQLGAILEEILSPDQYETNVATIPGSTERVEFAVRLPAKDGTVYLPIDSKFPGDRWQALLEAQESGDRDRIDAAGRALEAVLRQEAKDIRTKYVEIPYTTAFGIMFLPFEGLYAEVVNRGLIERLQQEYQVNVAGPSTMAALLNSLQMGFRTLAIQKRSGEVWEVLGAVKTEFGKFEETMQQMQRHLNQTSSDLENLMGTRSRAISRKLREVQELDDSRSDDLLRMEELTGPNP